MTTAPGGWRSVLVWLTGLLAYLVAVFHRSSLGVASLHAAERFEITASALGVFSMVQLAVYAAMQPPAGMLLDRFGSRRLIATGAALMATGQLAFSFAETYLIALLARVLIGLGDAVTFISVLRLVTVWFPPRRNPLFVQLTGALGQLGAIASAVPLVHVLETFGWQPAFSGAAGIGAFVVVLVVLMLRDAPKDAPKVAPPSLAQTFADMRQAWGEPSTRLGLWTHFVTQFSGTVFLLMWGYPFLVAGQGLPPATAGALLSALTVTSIVCGPVLGYLVGSRPFHRSSLVLLVVVMTASAWAAVLALSRPAPLWLLVVLIVAMGISAPASLIGFDFVRTESRSPRLGTATGLVNTGGFIASLVTIVCVGLLLDLAAPNATRGTTNYPLAAFRWAFAVQFAVWALGGVQVWRYRRRVRLLMQRSDPQRYAQLRHPRRASAPS